MFFLLSVIFLLPFSDTLLLTHSFITTRGKEEIIFYRLSLSVWSRHNCYVTWARARSWIEWKSDMLCDYSFSATFNLIVLLPWVFLNPQLKSLLKYVSKFETTTTHFCREFSSMREDWKLYQPLHDRSDVSYCATGRSDKKGLQSRAWFNWLFLILLSKLVQELDIAFELIEKRDLSLERTASEWQACAFFDVYC